MNHRIIYVAKTSGSFVFFTGRIKIAINKGIWFQPGIISFYSEEADMTYLPLPIAA